MQDIEVIIKINSKLIKLADLQTKQNENLQDLLLLLKEYMEVYNVKNR